MGHVMKARIQWVGEVGFEGSADSGHQVTMDGPPEFGGKNRGCRPMELVLIGMGGCTAFDVVHILKKGRQDITDCVAEVDAERAAVTFRCLDETPQFLECRTEVASCFQEIRFEGNRTLQVFGGFLHPSHFKMERAKLVMS